MRIITKGYIRCSDRMCGALDCLNCHPENCREVEENDEPDPDDERDRRKEEG